MESIGFQAYSLQISYGIHVESGGIHSSGVDSIGIHSRPGADMRKRGPLGANNKQAGKHTCDLEGEGRWRACEGWDVGGGSGCGRWVSARVEWGGYRREQTTNEKQYDYDLSASPRADDYGAYWIFPNVSMCCYPGGYFTIRQWLPVAWNKTIYRYRWFSSGDVADEDVIALMHKHKATTGAEDEVVVRGIVASHTGRGLPLTAIVILHVEVLNIVRPAIPEIHLSRPDRIRCLQLHLQQVRIGAVF